MTSAVVAGRDGCLVTCVVVAVAECHQGSGACSEDDEDPGSCGSGSLHMTSVVAAERDGCLVTCVVVAVAQCHQRSGVVKMVKTSCCCGRCCHQHD